MKNFHLFLLLSCSLSSLLVASEKKSLTSSARGTSTQTQHGASRDHRALPKSKKITFSIEDVKSLHHSIKEGEDDIHVFVDLFGRKILKSKANSGKDAFDYACKAKNSRALASIISCLESNI